MLVSIKERIFLVSPFSLFSDLSTLKIKSDDFFIVRFFDCSIQIIYLPEKGISFHTKAALKAHISKNHRPLNMQTHFDKN